MRDLLAVGTDERVWVGCEYGVATIAPDGTTVPVDCARCRHSVVAFPAPAGGMWFVDRRGGHWDLRLVRANGKLVGVRRLRGGWLTDFAEVNGRLYWLRSHGEAVGAILESIADRPLAVRAGGAFAAARTQRARR